MFYLWFCSFTSISQLNLFFFQLHSNVIRDVMFLHESWPWCKGQNALLTVAIDGTAKVFYGINDRQQFYLFGELTGDVNTSLLRRGSL